VKNEGIGFIRVRNGVTLRASPAREPDFNVVIDQAEMHKSPPGSAENFREQLHSNVNEEMQSLEIAAQSLVDFPEESWEIRMCLARQAWDEARHAWLFFKRLVEIGGYKGEFPVINQEWGVVCMFDSLAARLAVQNRVFEGGSLDVFKESAAVWAQMGDEKTAQIMDAVLVDEIRHSQFANEWLEDLRHERPRELLKAIAAMSSVKAWARDLSPPGMVMEHDIPVNDEDRLRAGF
jgi:uncharacterized ferritin-like protein (DUF455 family)